MSTSLVKEVPTQSADDRVLPQHQPRQKDSAIGKGQSHKKFSSRSDVLCLAHPQSAMKPGGPKVSTDLTSDSSSSTVSDDKAFSMSPRAVSPTS